jgi:alpha-glucosidase
MRWWQRAVFYQIYPLSFQDTTGNGMGDLQGIVARLDYLQDLGVDALWICPCFPSPWADWGYDVCDYTDIHPELGSLDTLDRLLTAAHARGLRVLLDFVGNHTSDQHPWFLESRKDRSNPKRDWYIWREPGPDGGPPNNWLSYFSGSAWEWDPATQQHYLHSFLKQQPDLNYRNPAVRAAMQAVLRFWLDRGVDGFRVDAVLPLLKDPLFRDDPVLREPAPGKDMGPAGMQDRVHSANQPEVHDLLREWRTLFDGYPGDRMMVGEVYTMDLPLAATYYGQDDELHLVHNFSLLNLPWEARLIRRYVEAFEASLPPEAFATLVLGSHDEPRLATRIGEAQARVAAMMLLTLRGAPFLYYGDEIGMLDGPVPDHLQRDPWPKSSGLAKHSRDPARTPMQWDDSPAAGFGPPGGDLSAHTAWLPIHPDYRARNVQAQLQDPGSLLQLYRRLLRLRRVSAALHSGAYEAAAEAPEGSYIYYRTHGDETMLVALNFGTAAFTISLDDPRAGRVLLSTGLDREEQIQLERFSVRPNEGILVQLEPRPAGPEGPMPLGSTT